MLGYRIIHKRFTDYLFAPGIAARWNSEGKKVLYCAESIPVAFMESMIRRQGAGFNHDFNIVIINIPDELPVNVLDIKRLPRGWRETKHYTACQLLGDAWYNDFETPVLKVPSAVITSSSNYVLNALHPGFKLISIVGVSQLVPDERIETILKKYKG